MEERITVRPMGPHEYGVEVVEGDTRTSHRVQVPDQLVDDLGVFDLDEATLVRESFYYLLDREPATSVQREFALDDIRATFDDYIEEMRLRLAP